MGVIGLAEQISKEGTRLPLNMNPCNDDCFPETALMREACDERIHQEPCCLEAGVPSGELGTGFSSWGPASSAGEGPGRAPKGQVTNLAWGKS